MREDPKQNLAHSVYEQLRSELFDFRLLPGDRFSEIEVAEPPAPAAHPFGRHFTASTAKAFWKSDPAAAGK